MTWDELVFRPLTADPFIYKGTGDVDPDEEPGGGRMVLRPDVYEAIRKDQGGRIYDPISGSGDYNPSDRDGSTVVVNPRRGAGEILPGGGEVTGKICYEPANAKNLWIKVPLKCQTSENFKWLKECAGFTNIAVGTDWAVIREAYVAGLNPTDLTMYITEKKICEACLDDYCPFDEFCRKITADPGSYSKEMLKNTLKECMLILAQKYNFAMERTKIKDYLPLRRIWIDEPGSQNEFICERMCKRVLGNQEIYTSAFSITDLMGGIFDAIRELREEGNPLFAAVIENGREVKTEFVISNYDSSWGPFGTNWIQKFGGLADFIYSDDYGSTQIDEWRYPEVQNGSVISLDENYNDFTELFNEANRLGWDTLLFFASLGFDGDPWSDTCERWRSEVLRFMRAAAQAGWVMERR